MRCITLKIFNFSHLIPQPISVNGNNDKSGNVTIHIRLLVQSLSSYQFPTGIIDSFVGAKEVNSSQASAQLPHPPPPPPDICIQVMVTNLRCYLHEQTFIPSQKATELTGSAIRIWLQNQCLLCFSPIFFSAFFLKKVYFLD